jgi:hypothetical protein
VPGGTGSDGGELHGVDALGRDDAWAVGFVGRGPSSTLIEHWDGSRWTRVLSRDEVVGKGRSLLAVDARTAADVLAVGSHRGKRAGAGLTLVEHWDGRTWSVLPSPNHGGDGGLTSVSAASASDAWAVGGAEGLVEHWDGSRWSLASACSFAAETDPVTSVASLPRGTVWLVGFVSDGDRDHYHTSAVVQLRPVGSGGTS